MPYVTLTYEAEIGEMVVFLTDNNQHEQVAYQVESILPTRLSRVDRST